MATTDHGDRREQPRSLTTLSPVEPDRLSELRWRLRFVANAPGVSRPLLELATVQYARWLVLSELPAPDGSGKKWPLNWSYLLFDASYDGSKLQYVRAFADVLHPDVGRGRRAGPAASRRPATPGLVGHVPVRHAGDVCVRLPGARGHDRDDHG